MVKAKEINHIPNEKSLVAHCGLFCGDCYRHKGKLADLARDLRTELRTEKFDAPAEKMAENIHSS